MKLTKIFIINLLLILTSCGGGTSSIDLPGDLLENDKGYAKLTDYIYSHYSNLEDAIEVMEFSYSASIHPQTADLSSSISMDFVKGDNKDRIVEYYLSSSGTLTNNNVDITIGDISNQKIANSYNTYKPFLFSNKEINFDVIRTVIEKSTEDFKKQTNANSAYCSLLTVKSNQGQKPIIQLRITQRKFASTVSRGYKWSLKGDKI